MAVADDGEHVAIGKCQCGVNLRAKLFGMRSLAALGHIKLASRKPQRVRRLFWLGR